MWVSDGDIQIILIVSFIVFLLIVYFFVDMNSKIQASREALSNEKTRHDEASSRYIRDLKAAKENYDREIHLQAVSIEAREKLLNEKITRGILSSIASGAQKSVDLFSSYSIFGDLSKHDFAGNPRLSSALSEKAKIIPPVEIRASIHGKTDVYTVTLNECTCPDFQSRHVPCKHMYRLAIQLGLLTTLDTSVARTAIAALDDAKASSEAASKSATSALQKISNAEKRLSEKEAKYREYIDRINADSSWLAQQYSDAFLIADMELAHAHLHKKAPAKRAADDIRRIAKEKNVWMKQAKSLEYRLSLYEALVPWLSETVNYTPQELFEANEKTVNNPDDEYAVLSTWLSSAEYYDLSEADRYQLSLDRYRRRKRNPWEIGRDFERYVGYQYESLGHRVSFYGALSGLADLGRDLLVRDGSSVLVVQCKRWMEKRTVHEKHVFQLFGSTISYEMEHPGSAPKGVLITTCPLSDVAVAYADRLGIGVKSNYPIDDLDTYPLIKCNISKTGEKIYHLPFDQQYDRVGIDVTAGEFYASTVQEAIDHGFRRAFRWRSSASES